MKKFVSVEARIYNISSEVAGSRQHICDCGKSYKLSSSLHNHRLVCGKPKQFSCPYCCHKAKYKGNLKKHVATLHTDMFSQFLEV